MVIHSQTEMLRQRIYQIMAGFEDVDDCDRGRMDQMIAELKNGLKADRMSCNKFTANQFRLYLHYALEKSHNPVPSGHLRMLLSGTSRGF